MGLALADVGPAAFNRWHGTSVYGGDVLLHKSYPECSIHWLVVDLLWLHAVHHSLSEVEHLLYKLWSQVFHANCIKALEISFVYHWTNHREAVTLWKVFPQVPLHFVLFGLATTGIWEILQSVFEVLLWVDLNVLVVD